MRFVPPWDVVKTKDFLSSYKKQGKKTSLLGKKKKKEKPGQSSKKGAHIF